MKHVLFAAALALSGCAAAPVTVSYSHPNNPGEIVFEHTNVPFPKTCVRGWIGCYQRRLREHHIYVTDLSPSHTLEHERAHMRGMQHSEWNDSYCAIVTQSGGKYREGQTLCIRDNQEVIIERKKS